MKTKKIHEQVTYWLGVVAVGLIFGLSLQFVQAWTEPSVAPPGGNVGAPLNISDIGQIKDGNLVLNSLGTYTTGLTVNGNMNVLNGNITTVSVIEDMKAAIAKWDTNNSDTIGDFELLDAIDGWAAKEVSDKVLNIVILLWAQNSLISGLPGSIGVANYNVFSAAGGQYSALFHGGQGVLIEDGLDISTGITKTTGGLIIETRTDDPLTPADGRMWLRTDL